MAIRELVAAKSNNAHHASLSRSLSLSNESVVILKHQKRERESVAASVQDPGNKWRASLTVCILVLLLIVISLFKGILLC